MISPLTVLVALLYYTWPLLLAYALWKALPQGLRSLLSLLFWGLFLYSGFFL
ncbi:MAG: hypothetical protein ACO4AU_15585 [bacterium]|jgi:hypothetical protein